MSITSGRHKAPNIFQFPMRGYAFNQPFASSVSAMDIDVTHIAQPGKRRVIGHNAGKADMCGICIHTKAEGMFH